MANNRIDIPQQVIAADCALHPSHASNATGVTEYSLRVACGLYERIRPNHSNSSSRCVATDGHAFWEWVYNVGELDRPLWIIGHKISTTLIATGFFMEMDAERVSLFPRSIVERKKLKRDPLFVLEDPPTILVAHDPHGRKLVIVDLINYLRSTADDTAALIGRSLDTVSTDVDSESATLNAVRDRTETWLAVFRELVAWVRQVGGTSFGYSAASQSFLCYRRRFQRQPIICEKDAWVKSLEGESMYTGRVEIIDPEPTNIMVHHVDVCSFYPWLMRENEFPRAVIDQCDSDHEISPMFFPHPEECIAHVRVSGDRHAYPIRKGTATRFRRGVFHTVLAGPELERGIRTGAVVDVYEWVRYRMSSLFKDWADWILSVRQRHKLGGNSAWETWAKLLGNSLYGKFAERRHKWELCEPPCGIDRWGFHSIRDFTAQETEEYKCIAGVCWKRGEKEYMPHAFPAITAFTTSYGRVYMDELIRQAGRDHVLYRAVDSLFVDDRGMERLDNKPGILESGAGCLRLVESATGFHARAINCYRHGTRTVEQGIKLTSRVQESGVYGVSESETLKSTLGRQPTQHVRIHNVIKRTQ